MIYSGLDWSEDVGGPLGYIAIVHVHEADLPNLETELAAARRRLGRDSDYVFKHVGAKENVHHVFYNAITAIPSLKAHLYRYDRSNWNLQHAKAADGDACVCDGIITLTLGCPADLVDDQILLIDLPRRERDVLQAFRTAIRQSMRQAHRAPFRSIKPHPDHRLEGGIVQAADMLAGEVREQSGIGGPFLGSLGSRVRMV